MCQACAAADREDHTVVQVGSCYAMTTPLSGACLSVTRGINQPLASTQMHISTSINTSTQCRLQRVACSLRHAVALHQLLHCLRMVMGGHSRASKPPCTALHSAALCCTVQRCTQQQGSRGSFLFFLAACHIIAWADTVPLWVCCGVSCVVCGRCGAPRIMRY